MISEIGTIPVSVHKQLGALETVASKGYRVDE